MLVAPGEHACDIIRGLRQDDRVRAAAETARLSAYRDLPEAVLLGLALGLGEGRGPSLRPRFRAVGIEPKLVGARRLLSPQSARLTVAHLRAVRPDVVHTHMGYSDYLGGRAARALGVPGFARNRADGAVEIVAEGDRMKLERLLEWAQMGPPRARVNEVDVEWSAATGEFSGFAIG